MEVENVPDELEEQYRALAKLEYDGETWKVLAEALAALKDDKYRRIDLLDERISKLEEELGAVKGMVKKSNGDKNGGKKTLG